MAIRDLKQRLETQEGKSGEALLKTLTGDLNKVYGDAQGWQKFVGSQNKGLSIKGADSLWEEAYKEILKEAKDAVRAKKSDKAKEILGDLISLTKDIAATEGVNAPIAAGIQAMLDAVLPSIELRIDTLKKGEGIFKSMKKKAISSAAGAVESFASGLLAPLPFGAGEAIIGKAKGFLGGGKKERRGEQAMSFASRLEGGGIETSGAEGGAEGAGGKTAKTLMGTGKEEGGIVSEKNLEETNDILRDILVAVSPDREALEEAKRKKEMLRQEGKGGKVKFGDKGWMKAMMSGVMAGAMVIGAIAAAVGALVMMVFDGIEGYFLAEEWGVSKMNAVIGAVLGGTGKGLTGAMWGGVKGGAAGFAIGMLVGGPLGAIIGGAVGMLIGGIAGWFGGERIAKLLEELTSWFERKWKALRVGLGLDAYSDEDIEKIKKEETKLAAADVKKQEDILKRFGKDKAAEHFGVSEESITEAKVKHERVSKATVGEIKRGEHHMFNEGTAGSAIVSSDIASDVAGFTGSKTVGQAVGTTVFALDEFSRLLASLDPTSGNFLGSGYGTYNLVKGTSLEKYFSKQGIIGGPATEFLSASLSNFWSPKNSKMRSKVAQWNAENAILNPVQPLKQKEFNAENVPSLHKASGGFIVNRPTYLPSSGVMVGEHPSYSGRGRAYDGGPEAVIRGAADGLTVLPLEKSPIVAEFAKETGAIMNQMAMDKIGYERGRGSMYEQPPTIIDNSTIQNVSNNTVIRSPSPSGPNLHFEGRDFVHKIA